jgi:AcrR family transcriptional regulator
MCDPVDPRVRRTHQLLHQALAKLLETKEFSKISVQDVADEATLNRATFYAHYPDKYALLECMVAGRFQDLLDARGITFDGTCTGALRAIVLGVCDYLASTPRLDCEKQAQMEPHLESAVINVVGKMLLDGLKNHSTTPHPEIVATATSCAIYGAARQWLLTPARCSSEDMAGHIVSLVSPLLGPQAKAS